MAATTAPRFRYIGVVDDVTDCQQCGKPELKRTVVIMPLDADGNDDGDVTYYGTTCAARALGVSGGGRSVAQSAQWAQERTAQAAKEARAALAFYGLPVDREPTLAEFAAARNAFIDAHRNAQWAPGTTRLEWHQKTKAMYARHCATLAEAALVGA